jgi:hypothetical protein
MRIAGAPGSLSVRGVVVAVISARTADRVCHIRALRRDSAASAAQTPGRRKGARDRLPTGKCAALRTAAFGDLTCHTVPARSVRRE